MQVPKKMRAARLHEIGGPAVVDEVDVPVPGDDDVLVRIRSCGMVPNLANVLRIFGKIFPDMPFPPYPAIFGLDPAGEIVQLGRRVKELSVGDRVYVNPMRACNSCRQCIDGNYAACAYFTLNGYFGLSPKSKEMFERYPSGGFAEYMKAPSYAVAKISDRMSFNEAARLGYIGTAYAGLRRGGVGPTSTVLIDGASGTLGLSAVISALAMGAPRILGVARDRALLEEVKAIAPHRIEVRSTHDGPIGEWAREMTDGEGVDVAIDCLPVGAPPAQFLACLHSIRRGGVMVNVSGVFDDLTMNVGDLCTRSVTLIGSNWFEPKHAREMAALAGSGLLDVSIFDHKVFGLHQVDTAISSMDARRGGFTNYVICP